MIYVTFAALTMLFMVSVLFGPPGTARPHMEYLSYVVRHKWWVLVAGLRLGPPVGWLVLRHLRWWLQLLVHDWSKFQPSEWGPYADYFYGPPVEQCQPCKRERQKAFDVAWLHHQHRNPHHWQRWLLRPDKPESTWSLRSTRGSRWPAITVVILHHEEQGKGAEGCIAAGHLLPKLVEQANAAPRALPMPERYAREMVADWMGAGRTITGTWDTPGWYATNRRNMVLHPETRQYVEMELRELASSHGRLTETSLLL